MLRTDSRNIGSTAMSQPRSSVAGHADDFARDTLLGTYNRADLTIDSGEGLSLRSEDGRRLLDFSSGVAVVNLGHRHPRVLEAAHAQLDKIWHASNHFWNRPMLDLAFQLSERFGGAKAFFCNSGAEANEAAIKFARKATGRSGIVALQSSFHGRTCGALSITGQPAKRDMFFPLLPDVTFVEANDAEALRRAMGPDIGLLIMEAVQGEGGVRPLEPNFARIARDLCTEHGAVLALDEIQTGIGRTGTFFGFEALGIRPDLVTLAKGLSNGLPIGCLLVANSAPRGFEVGDHATTFGGNPVACAAGVAVLAALTPDVLNNCVRQGRRLMEELAKSRGVLEVRGRGLLIGCEVERPAADLVRECREAGLVATAAGPTVLRLTPPLVINDAEVEEGLRILSRILN